MVIRQGDIFWTDLDEPVGSEPGYRHPFVIVQNNLFNQTAIRTVIACSITSNLKRAAVPGNVLLQMGEGGLDKSSVVNVSQIYTLDKTELREFCGSLSKNRIDEIITGINLLLTPADTDE